MHEGADTRGVVHLLVAASVPVLATGLLRATLRAMAWPAGRLEPTNAITLFSGEHPCRDAAGEITVLGWEIDALNEEVGTRVHQLTDAIALTPFYLATHLQSLHFTSMLRHAQLVNAVLAVRLYPIGDDAGP